MNTSLSIIPIIGLFLFSFTLQAQQEEISWEDFSENQLLRLDLDRRVTPKEYRTLHFDLELLKGQLENAPLRFDPSATSEKPLIELPLPDGRSDLFELTYAPVMHPELATKYPQIKSYTGVSTIKKSRTVRLTLNQEGLFAMILSPDYGTVRIRPYAEEITDTHISYFAKDINLDDWEPFECLTNHEEDEADNEEALVVESDSDCQLRTYDLAIACTGEYAGKHGGTVAGALAAINVVAANMSLLYERDAGITFILVPNNDEIIYTNGATDPYTNTNASSDIATNATNLNNVIGAANYDIGHVLTTNGGGLAGVGVVCNNNWKARGESGSNNPEGYYFETIVHHEVGHQFSARHAQNNSCNYTASSGVEPGSGSTIMSYAGVCSPNVQWPADDYYNGLSLDQITNYSQNGSGNGCADLTDVGNLPPVVDAGADYDLPSDSYFELTGTATNPDEDAQLFNWEQINPEQGEIHPPLPTNSQGPVFRSWEPSGVPLRIFPKIEEILSGNNPPWEVLPSVDRTMDFRLSVRDLHEGIGCLQQEDVFLEFHETPSNQGFEVLTPNTNETIFIGENTIINWDPVGSFNASVDCEFVDIYLSQDGGYTYPILLAENIENQPGTYNVEIPINTLEGTENRIKVKCSDNIFFDISDVNFALELPPQPTFFMQVLPESQDVCGAETPEIIYQIDLNQFLNFDEEISFSVSGLPEGATATFSQQSVIPPAIVDLVISDMEDVPAGSYELTVFANSLSVNRELEVNLNYVPDIPQESINLFLPEDGTLLLPVANSVLSWNPIGDADEYEVEVATNPAFGASVVFSTVTDLVQAIPTGLESYQIYYWRVRGMNPCGYGPYSEIFAFETEGVNCETFTYEGNDIDIPTNSPDEVILIEVPLEIPFDRQIIDLNVRNIDMQLTWPGDMGAMLIAPDETEVRLFHRPGVPASTFGCANDDMLCDFDDEAGLTYQVFESTCVTTSPSISGSFQPEEPLSSFIGKSTLGVWTLLLEDYYPSADGGTLTNWELDICSGAETIAPPMLIYNQILEVQSSSMAYIDTMHLRAADSTYTDAEITFTLLELPNRGLITKGGDTLSVGGQFTQEDINNNIIAYHHDGSEEETDAFRFDIRNAGNGWLPNQSFQINVIQAPIVFADLVSNISCTDENDGSITVNATGGTPPFQYSLDGENFQEESIFNGLSSGIYTVIVLDDAGNEVETNEVEIINPDPVTVTASVSAYSIDVAASGGTGDLSYSLNGVDFQDASSLMGTAPGLYTITVIDENGCIGNTEVELIFEASLEIESELNCFEGNDGSIYVTVNGGGAPFQYSINGSDYQDSPLFENLTAGDYSIQVIDNYANIIQTNEVSISNPPELTAFTSISNFEITVSASGGTGNYEYSIDGQNFQASNTFLTDDNAEYTLIVQDENGCQTTVTALVWVNTLVVSANVQTELSCYDSSDGSIEVIVEGGTPPFQYSLNGGDYQDEAVFHDLPAGVYTIEVLDEEGFTLLSNEVEVTNPPELSLTATVNDFEITVTAMGGTGNYQYALGGVNFQDESIFLVDDNDTYVIIVQDENGCLASTEAVVSVNTLVVMTNLVNEISCYNAADGSLEVTVEGGTAPFQYSLNGGTYQGSNVFQNLSEGTYSVEVLDSEGFTLLSNEVTFVNPNEITASAIQTGYNIEVEASGGAGGLQFSLDGINFQNEAVFNNLENGNYTITVQDSEGCSVQLDVELFVVPLTADLVILSQISCYLANDGELDLSVAGGVEPYEYSLNGGGFTDNLDLNNLGEGTYQITVVDAGGISVETIEITLLNPPELIIPAINVGETTFSLFPEGGTGDYQYSLDGVNFQSEHTFSDMLPGYYDVIVIDENGCEATILIELNLLDEVAYNWEDIECNGEANGIINLCIQGGLEPFEVQIEPEAGSYSVVEGDCWGEIQITDLPPGFYMINILDQLGDSSYLEVTIEEPAILELETTLTENQLTVNGIGGTPPYMYSIDGVDFQESNLFEDLPNGTYDVIVMDAEGCNTSETIIVSGLFTVTNSLAFKLFPNPNDGQFFIEFDAMPSKEVVLTLYDVIGRTVYSKVFEGNEWQQRQLLDLQELPAGMYELRIQNGDRIGSRKVVVE